MTEPLHDHERSDPARLPARPLVSVLMITYNQAAYIEQAIRSVLDQETDFPFEIVVGEDCSTDGTRAIVERLQAERPDRIRLLTSDRNLGFQGNARRVLNACRGTYVAILEGDDYWLVSDKLQRQVALLDAHPEVGICIGRGQRIHPDGRAERFWDRGHWNRVIPLKEMLAGDGMVMPTGSILARASRLRALPDWVFEAPVLDIFLFLGAASPGGALYLAEDISAYRMAAEGSWSADFRRDYDAIKVRHARRMLECYEHAVRDFGLDRRWLRRLLSGFHHVLAKAEYGDGHTLAAFGHLSKVSLSYFAARLDQRLFEPRR